ncbi:uncharacterized protein BJ171DRAFT_505169 [Polychytrium aggregatum]|uniref:uncharacterized protein n=1 Tax=Polychytrium aggregatum TaxID=110093 RepID=UPI0022FE969C|nr:uncharacterized protein BJ171DRAFT_505169 [Polychytrium aggregatum]KAI9204707.1 hypothetical protein BJ171DRAFT_505169 [Polychytrium aggregatum]
MGSLNAVVIALPTNQSKLTVWFRFCIMELFKYLDREVIQNIIFLFTKAQATSFRMGDTIHVLKRLFGEIKDQSGIEIPLSESNTFLIDNEAYRYLMTPKEMFHFDESEVKQFKDSWNKSAQACQKLVELASRGSPKSFEKTGQLEVLRSFLDNHSEELMNMESELEQTSVKMDKIRSVLSTLTAQINHLEEMKEEVITLSPEILSSPVEVCQHPECADYFLNRTGYHKFPPKPARSAYIPFQSNKNSPCKSGYNHESKYHQRTIFQCIPKFEQRLPPEILSQIHDNKRSLDLSQDRLAELEMQERNLKIQQRELLRLVAICNQQIRKHSVVHRNETFLDENDFQVIQQQAFTDGIPNEAKLRKLEALKRSYEYEKNLMKVQGRAYSHLTLNEAVSLISEFESKRQAHNFGSSWDNSRDMDSEFTNESPIQRSVINGSRAAFSTMR